MGEHKIQPEADNRAGHRGRLRQKFLKAGLDGFLDYEIIELLLTLGTPRRDCKEMAKQAIKKFGNLQNVLDASVEELQQIKGIGSQNAFGVKLFQEIAAEYDKRKVNSKKLLASPSSVANYLKRKFGNKKKEYFILLFLDSKDNLINKEISIGILDEIIIHPREIFKEAINFSAAKVVIAHNHPSGDTSPSEKDLEVTKLLAKAGKVLNIEILDHIIFSNSGFFSVKKARPELLV